MKSSLLDTKVSIIKTAGSLQAKFYLAELEASMGLGLDDMCLQFDLNTLRAHIGETIRDLEDELTDDEDPQSHPDVRTLRKGYQMLETHMDMAP